MPRFIQSPWLQANAFAYVVSITAGLLAPAEVRAAIDYTVDPTHTRIAFRVDHAGLSKALGTFAGATGKLRFDPDNVSASHLTLTVPIASLDLGDADWEGKVLDGTFFDAADFPQATFVSTSVAPLDGKQLQVRGDLTIHGVTRPVAFEATFNALARHPLNFRRTAGFSAVLVISRKDFGMGAWPSVVGDRVEILVELEAVRVRGSGEEEEQQDQQLPPPQPSPASQGREQSRLGSGFGARRRQASTGKDSDSDGERDGNKVTHSSATHAPTP